MLHKLFILIPVIISIVQCSKILVIPSPSTVKWTRLTNISQSLVDLGHQVTLLDLYSQVVSKIGGVDIEQGISQDATLSERAQCQLLIEDKKSWLDGITSTGWDLVIISQYNNPCARLIASRTGAKVILFSDTYLQAGMAVQNGCPMSLTQAEWWQNTRNPFTRFSMALRYAYELISAYSGSMLDNLILGSNDIVHGEMHVLVDYTPLLDWPGRSKPSTIVDVGGIQCKSKELQKHTIDERSMNSISTAAKKGIILVDITDGSTDHADVQKLSTALNNLVDYAVVWYMNQNLPTGSTTLKQHIFLVGNRQSLFSLLGNSKTKLLLSGVTQWKAMRSLCAMVPVFGIAFNNIQQGLSDRYMHHGLVVGQLHGLKDQALYIEQTIKKALKTREGQASQLKELKSLLSEDMQTPTEKALFWIEFVLRHGTTEAVPHTGSIYIIPISLLVGLCLLHQMKKLVSLSFTLCLCRSSDKKTKKE